MSPTLDVRTLDIPTPQEVAALVYLSLEELAARLPDVPEAHRFLAKLVVGPVPAHAPNLGPCLLWGGAINSRGYPMFKTKGEAYPGKPRTVAAHKWLDHVLHGEPVPEGYELDHMCHEPSLCTVPVQECPHRPCVLHTLRRTRRANRLRANHILAVNAAKVRCDGEFAPIDPVTGEKIGHLLTDEQGRDTANCYRPPKSPNQRKCRACQHERSVRWMAEARRLRAQARERGLADAGQLELIAG